MSYKSSSRCSAETTGARIRQQRKEKDIKIRELAELTGLTTTSISYLENGKTKPSLYNLRKLSQTLGADISYLGCFENMPETTLGDKIKKARMYHGKTIIDLAKSIGVDVKTVGGWEKSEHEPLERYMPMIKSLLKILYE
jgi:transcriptional regulator with XRE-family HTH domain